MSSAMFPDLNGRSVLITGGGSGIGAALTLGFARQGCKVAFIDIARQASEALCAEVEAECGMRPLFLNVDLTDTPALQAAIAEATAKHGAITVLVNNAAFDQRHAIEDVTPDFWDKNQAINLKHAFFAIQAVLPGMKSAGGGAIVNFTSISFMLNMPGMASYTAAKAGVIGLTKGLAMDLGSANIRINSIMPGWVMTERQKQLWATKEGLEAFLARQSIKQLMQPEDIVGPCLFLASDAAGMVTAQTLIVDGGVL